MLENVQSAQSNLNQDSLDRMIQDTISKVTTTQSSASPLHQVSNPILSTPQSNFTNPHRTTHHCSQSLDQVPLTPQNIALFPSSKFNSSNNAAIKHLPQDILHILESDFTSVTPGSCGETQKEISRVAEQLRVQVRLSRYQKVRDQLSDSEDEHVPVDGEESEESETERSNHEENQVDDAIDLDQVDGSGDEDVERIKNNAALAKLKVEIEQIIGIPEHSEPSNSIQSQNLIPISKTETNLVSSVDQGSQKEFKASTPESETKPNFNSVHVDVPVITTDLSGDLSTADESVVAAPILKSEPSVPQLKEKKPLAKQKVTTPDDSGDETDGLLADCDTFSGPKTAHELKEPPSEVIEVPFTHLSETEMKTMSPFGVITSLIGNVLVIKGTDGLGYDRVLDESTLACCKNGLVIGKIFETFGSVTSPHYSIRLPNHILTSAGRVDDDLNLTPGVEVYHIPSHSKFVFTAELRAQPRGTDASNLFDEEVDHEEVEFSDDEAEAAYVKACKLAKKNSANSRHPHHNHAQDHVYDPSDSFHLSEQGRHMFVKRKTENSNHEDKEGEVESDYSLLERPKGLRENGNPGSMPTAVNQPNRPPTKSRFKSKKQAGARGRNSNKGPSQQHYHESHRQTNNSLAASEPSIPQPSNSYSNGSTGPVFQSKQQMDTLFRNFHRPPLPWNYSANTPQAATGLAAMTMAQQGQSEHSLTSQFNPNMTSPTLWNGSTVNSSMIHGHNNTMMMPMMMMNNLATTGIPCYNPYIPSLNSNFVPPLAFGFHNYIHHDHHLNSNQLYNSHQSDQDQHHPNSHPGVPFNFDFNNPTHST